MPKAAAPEKVDSFQGFPKQALTFFRQLSRNNDRDWFTPRKDDYEEHCRRPMELLVAALNGRLKKFALEYVAPDPRKALYRIYRDTRFSKDKTPYKTHVAAHFDRKGYARHAGPGFYVQVNHKSVGVAGGIYMTGPDDLRAIRHAIAVDPKSFLKAVSHPKVLRLMGPLSGDALTRLPKGFESAGPDIEPFLRMKYWCYWKELDADLALSPKLVPAIADRIEAMLPACEWIHTTLTRAAGTDDDNKPKRPEPMF